MPVGLPGQPITSRVGVLQPVAAGGGGGPFDPLDLSPHVLLNPDNFGLVDGDPVATAVDTSASGPDWTQPTSAQRPTLRGGASLLNGHFVVEHDGVDDYLPGPDLSALTNGHVFIVVKVDVEPPASGQGGLWRLGTDSLDDQFTWTDGIIYDGAMSTARKTVGDPAAALTSWRIYEVRSAANDWEAKLDGVSLHSTGTNTVGLSATPQLGRAGASYVFDGRWAYFAMFPALSSGDATSMRSWLQTRFGL